MRIRAATSAAILIVCSVLGTAARAQAPATQPAEMAFEKLKASAGEWEAKDKDGSVTRLSSQVTSNGTALAETLHEHGEMITVYHVDGDTVLMTHYCAVGNQPRMQARGLGSDGKTLAFTFKDATNMPDPNAGHMHQLTTTFLDADHMTQEWTFYDQGKAVFTGKFQFSRVK